MHLQVICLGIMKYLLVVLDRALDAPDPPKGGEGGGSGAFISMGSGPGGSWPSRPKAASRSCDQVASWYAGLGVGSGRWDPLTSWSTASVVSSESWDLSWGSGARVGSGS
jgi:hypothetical protein